jgi:putative endopeptidase
MKILRLAVLLSAFAVLTACDESNTKMLDVKVAEVDAVQFDLMAAAERKYGAWGVDLATQDLAIQPGDDFYSYTNGAWLNEYELPADKSKFGMLGLLNDEAKQDVKEIIVELSDKENTLGSVEQQVGDLYASYMDMERRNQQAIKPLQAVLERLGSISSHDQLYNLFAQAPLLGSGSALGAFAGIDRKDPNQKVMMVWADGTGLPDRDYYLVDSPRFEKIRDAYVQHIATMLVFAGYEQMGALQAAREVMAMETKIAGYLMTRVESRDANKTYNAFTYDELKNEFLGVQWDQFVTATGVDLEFVSNKKWVIRSPKTVKGVLDVINNTSLQTWKDYLIYSVVANNAGHLSEELELASFEFQKVLSGQQQLTERWKRGVGMVSAMFGEAVGEVYVKRHFPEASKAQMKVIIENLRSALHSRLTNLAWMSDATKQQAQLKLESFYTEKIGYPDKWEDYQGLSISKDNLYGNITSARHYLHHKRLKELVEPVDRTKWNMTPQTVNAYYSPLFNEIVFPAAILQAPLFDMTADPAVNYGAIGAIIGHEMSHGFDDQGRNYDATGRLHNWWLEQDSEEFDKLAAKLVEQYNAYEAVPGVFVNGQFTLGENIGDLGGVMIAYQAYKDFLNGKQAPVLNGFTGEQRFFLAWAQVWREKVREAAQVQLIKSDPHSPGRFRVNGILRNVDAWYDAFDVQEGNAMYLAPEQRVRIW